MASGIRFRVNSDANYQVEMPSKSLPKHAQELLNHPKWLRKKENIYYGITCGDNLVRAYVLNTEISIAGEQTDWLKKDLANNKKALWRIAQYHKPMRPHVGGKREGNGQYMEWANLFYKEKVKLVVECDAHTVKTTWPLKPSTEDKSEEGFVRDNRKGTVYVGEGCWGAPLRPSDDSKSWTRDHGSFNQFKWIFIDKKHIELRTIKVDNAEEVSSVSNDNPFKIPRNLDIWKPENGALVKIRRYQKVACCILKQRFLFHTKGSAPMRHNYKEEGLR